MKPKLFALLPAFVAALAWCVPGSADDTTRPRKAWNLSAEIVEASTDLKFCPCYDTAANDRNTHRCRFIAIMTIREGSLGDVKLDGMKIALAGDLGRDLSGVEMSTLVILTEPSASKEQKDAIDRLIRELYPMKWTKKVHKSGNIDFESDADGAKARLADMGTLGLTITKDENGVAVVRKGSSWWNARVNDGFKMATGYLTFRGEGLDYSQPSCSGFMAFIQAQGELLEHP